GGREGRLVDAAAQVAEADLRVVESQPELILQMLLDIAERSGMARVELVERALGIERLGLGDLELLLVKRVRDRREGGTRLRHPIRSNSEDGVDHLRSERRIVGRERDGQQIVPVCLDAEALLDTGEECRLVRRGCERPAQGGLPDHVAKELLRLYKLIQQVSLLGSGRLNDR